MKATQRLHNLVSKYIRKRLVAQKQFAPHTPLLASSRSPQNSARSNSIFWRPRAPFDVLTVQSSCGVTVVLIRISATVISTHFIDTARPYENSSAKMFNSSYPERNFRVNQLLDASISLSPLYPSVTNDLPVSIVTSFQLSFL